MPPSRALARGDTRHKSVIWGDSGRYEQPVSRQILVQNASELLVDPARVLTHPSFNEAEGEGILTYQEIDTLEPVNPDITRGFILSPAKGVETTIQKTLGGSATFQFLQDDSDVVVTEIWTGGADKLSMPAAMFRTFYRFWTTIPEPGKFLTWAPADLTEEVFGVHIVDLQLGTPDQTYREHRTVLAERAGAFLSETVTIKYKIVDEDIAPRGTITLSGL